MGGAIVAHRTRTITAIRTRVRVLTIVVELGVEEAIQLRPPHHREGEPLRLREGGPHHPLSRRSHRLLQDHALGSGLVSAGLVAVASIRVAGMEQCARMGSRSVTSASPSLTLAWIGVSAAHTCWQRRRSSMLSMARMSTSAWAPSEAQAKS